MKPHAQFWKQKIHNFIWEKAIIKKIIKKIRTTLFQKFKTNSLSLSLLELYAIIIFFMFWN